MTQCSLPSPLRITDGRPYDNACVLVRPAHRQPEAILQQASQAADRDIMSPGVQKNLKSFGGMVWKTQAVADVHRLTKRTHNYSKQNVWIKTQSTNQPFTNLQHTHTHKKKNRKNSSFGTRHSCRCCCGVESHLLGGVHGLLRWRRCWSCQRSCRLRGRLERIVSSWN